MRRELALSDGNQELLFVLGVAALTSVEGVQSYVALERRHPDGERWVEIARFLTNADARAALAHVVEGGHADPSEVRVHRVHLPQP